MSSALLKKSLELVDSDFVHKNSVINSNQGKLVYSELKLKKKPGKNKESGGVADLKKVNLNSVKKIKKQHRRKENTGANKKKLRLLHKPPNNKIVNKILDHLGYGDRRKEKAEEEQKTVFTEEDFLKFEKEYVDTD